jgi:mannitol-1-phosphate 5-dehydrogenase
MGHAALLDAIGAGLRFDPADDPEAVELQLLLGSASAPDVVEKVTGIPSDHPLYPGLLAAVEARQAG